MNNKNNRAITIAVIALVVVLGIISYILFARPSKDEIGQSICNPDTKMCPDGSVVGRIAPSCDFMECSVVGNDSSKTTNNSTNNTKVTAKKVEKTQIVTVRLGETASINGVSIKPVSVLEDSRCFAGVKCIQAGSVRVSVKFQMSNLTIVDNLVLGVPTFQDGLSIALIDVTPSRVQSRPVVDSEYVFTFKATY